jgi:hypothetical protein
VSPRLIEPIMLNEADAAPLAVSLSQLAEDLRTRLAGLIAAHADATTGFVDYCRLARSAEWRAVVETTGGLAGARAEELATPDEQIAFWANLYNALIVHAIVALDIREGVSEVHEFFRRIRYVVGGQAFSLIDIEHGVLRQNRPSRNQPDPVFAPEDRRRAWMVARFDPRVHFALMCGTRSCPPIRAYRAERLEAQLDLATRGFVNADVEVDPARSTLRLSRLFYWYAADFGALVPWLLRHLDPGPGREWLAANVSATTLEYRAYDWALNDRGRAVPLA